MAVAVGVVDAVARAQAVERACPPQLLADGVERRRVAVAIREAVVVRQVKTDLQEAAVDVEAGAAGRENFRCR